MVEARKVIEDRRSKAAATQERLAAMVRSSRNSLQSSLHGLQASARASAARTADHLGRHGTLDEGRDEGQEGQEAAAEVQA